MDIKIENVELKMCIRGPQDDKVLAIKESIVFRGLQEKLRIRFSDKQLVDGMQRLQALKEIGIVTLLEGTHFFWVNDAGDIQKNEELEFEDSWFFGYQLYYDGSDSRFLVEKSFGKPRMFSRLHVIEAGRCPHSSGIPKIVFVPVSSQVDKTIEVPPEEKYEYLLKSNYFKTHSSQWYHLYARDNNKMRVIKEIVSGKSRPKVFSNFETEEFVKRHKCECQRLPIQNILIEDHL